MCVRYNECFWIGREVASVDYKPLNLDVGKLGVVSESFKTVLDCFKILLQLGTIQFDLLVINFMLLFCYKLKSIYIFNIPIF
jgi:hypothetical protein